MVHSGALYTFERRWGPQTLTGSRVTYPLPHLSTGLAEIGQMSRSHAVSTLVHLNAQPETNAVSDIQPVQNMASEMGQSLIVLAAV